MKEGIFSTYILLVQQNLGCILFVIVIFFFLLLLSKYKW